MILTGIRNTKTIKQNGRFLWTRTYIVSGIKALRRNKIPLHSASLQKERSSHVSQILKKAIGTDTSGAKLLNGAIGYYGSWDEALRKSGIDPKRIKKYEKFWTKELVVKGVLALEASGVPLHVNGIVKDKSVVTRTVLQDAIGRDLTGLRIHSAGYRLFGSWYQALEAAGIDPQAIRHDEIFWTKDNIIKSVKKLYENDVPLYIYRLSRDRLQSTTNTLMPIVGRPVTGAGLYIAAMKKYGSWDKVLITAGIEPYEIRNDTKLWPKIQMLNAIKALYRKKVPLCVVKIEKDRSSNTSDIIYKASKIRTTGFSLYRISIKRFGSWDNALKSAGINPFEIRRATQALSKDFIIRSIKKLHMQKFSLNYRNLAKADPKAIAKIIDPSGRRAMINVKLYSDSKKQFGSWDLALKAAGLEPKKIRRDKGFWTKQKIIDSILALNEAGVRLDCTKMQFNKSPETSKILYSIVGRKTTGASLYGAVAARYGSWSKVVRVVKRNPEALGSRAKYISGWLVQKSIRNLHKAGVPLNMKEVITHDSPESKAILKKVTEGDATTRAIYAAARKHFNTWDEALANASLDPSVIRLSGMSVKCSGKTITELILSMQQGGFALNTAKVMTNSKTIRSHNYKKVGKVVSGYSVWAAAKKEIGDWESALETAGLDPIEIVLKSKRKWSLSILPHQVEREKMLDGSVRKVAYLGPPPKTPDEEYEESLISDSLDRAVMDLSHEDQALTSKIFDLILETNKFTDQASLINSIVERIGGEVTKERVAQIFLNLARNPALLSIR